MTEKLISMDKNKEGGLKEALKGLGGEGKGAEKKGFLGKDGNTTRKPDYIPPTERLTQEDAERKDVIKALLTKWIVPNELSFKSTRVMDRNSLARKLNRTTLQGLLAFLPVWMRDLDIENLKKYQDGDEELGSEDLAEIQENYRDLSP